jgi:ABC-type polar amino acid transport system ATPase subunit
MAKQDEPNKVIYSMVGVGKVHGQKQVVTNIGLDGSGEPTLLRIMADVETAAG